MRIQWEQAKLSLRELEAGINDIKASITFDTLQQEVADLELKTGEAGFWDDPQESQKILKVLKVKKSLLENYLHLRRGFDDVSVLIDMTIEEDDESMVEDVLADLEAVRKEFEDQRIEVLLCGEYDGNNAIISIHPGAGGTEAQDWAQMLYRMYLRYAERKKFKVKVLDYLDGDEAGIKSASFLVEGTNAYGYLKSESGVHRLVRVSPFDAGGRR